MICILVFVAATNTDHLPYDLDNLDDENRGNLLFE
jgi:hypothetical protein